MSSTMAESCPAAPWGDASDFSPATSHAEPLPRQSLEARSSSPSSPLPPKSISPPPRSSLDSAGRASASHWRENETLERRDTLSSIPTETATLVEPSFDENVLRTLCELDCGVPLLLDRIKQSTVSCKEASTFLKHRAKIEEDYGRSLQKLARTTAELYAMSDGKAGTFVNAWHGSMRIHDVMAESRLRFAQRLNEMSEELSSLVKEVDKNRKQTKDLAGRYERALQESELMTEKSKNRLDATSDELERVLLQKEGESIKESAVRSPSGAPGKRAIGKAVAKGGMLLKGKNPGNILRQEDDIRSRVSNASDSYRKSVTDTQAMRQEYFNFQLPRILRALKECADEVDLGTQYHLTRYSFLFESTVLSDGSTLVPAADEDAMGLKATFESIDNRSDFKVYMQHYAYAHGNTPARGPKREGPQDQGFLPLIPAFNNRGYASDQASSSNHTMPPPQIASDKGRPTFGVDLALQMTRDNVEVPTIMEKCCAAIEKYGLQNQGIYRLSGMVSKVQKLKDRLDRDIESVNLDSEEWSSDVNNITSVMKLWLRELPDPLLTMALHQGFIEAAKTENDRLRHIRLHERVNDLPDPNYATLKYFLGHLHRINQHESDNSMSIQNLAIVFGPTLFGQIAPTVNGHTNGGNTMADTAYQNKAIETILQHYTDIFVDETDDDANV